eukprot:TRINITY_DN20609_c0_g1_i1.p1 TRINITY_DN20609_c0_g1~~TRINITY_DN20609_c0_g1_i1.p1  ORF type:complete len:203 (-),score=46.68 TRINITY_DN20609_c0_g1_i1:62-670(-)
MCIRDRGVSVSTRELTCVRVRRKDIHKAMDTLHPDDRAQLVSILENAIISGRRGLMAVPEPKAFWVPESKAALAAKAGAVLTATTPKKAGHHNNNNTDRSTAAAQQSQQHLAPHNKSFGGGSSITTSSRGRAPRSGGGVHSSTVDDRNTDSAMGGTLTVYSLSLIHISEPTRLLSISYAVFCLKKKKKNNKKKTCKKQKNLK